MQADDILKFSSIEKELKIISNLGYSSTELENLIPGVKQKAGLFGNPAYYFNQAVQYTDSPSYVKQSSQSRLSELSAFSKEATIGAGLIGAVTLGFLFTRL